MKVIFLDIDGVLNWDHSKSRCSGYIGIDTVRVRRLARIVEAVDAKIVLISTWGAWFEVGAYKQKDKPSRYLSNKLRKQGLKVYDKINYDIAWKYRGRAILEYLNEHPQIDGWVVLDDELFTDYGEKIQQHLVHTVFYTWKDQQGGLTESLIPLAIDILNNKIEGPVVDPDFKEEWKIEN